MAELDDLAAAANRPAIGYATPRPPAAHVPNYSGIGFGAAIVRIVAALSGISGIFSLVGGLTNVYSAAQMTGTPMTATQLSQQGYVQVVTGLSALAISAFLFLAASLAAAIRDMARNSFLR